MKGFVIEGSGQPEVCPEGHRGEPELTAAGRRRKRVSRHARRHDQLEGSQYSTLMVAKLDKIKNPTLRFGLVL